MKSFLISLSTFFLLGTLGLVVTLKVAGRDLPSPEHLQAITPATKTRVLDRNQRLIGEFYRENRVLVRLEDTPPDLIHAFIAVEDRNFWDHWGIHLASVARAGIKNVLSLRVREGASTITQQLARNLFLTHEQTVARKIREAVLALRIEQNYSKDEILEMYLNQIYFGDGAYGIQSAARSLFGKDIGDLNLAESALLAGLPRNPWGYSPFRHPEASIARRNLVLRSMKDCGFITGDQFQAARAETLDVATGPLSPKNAPYFMEMVRLVLERELGTEAIFEGGLTVYTTLDLDWQHAAETALEAHVASLEADTRAKVTRATFLAAQDKSETPVAAEYLQAAALVVDAQTGAIRVLVGGRSFEESNFNRATSAKRQPGSAFKPFIYLTAIEKGYYPSYTVMDAPVVFYERGQEPWRPGNYDHEFRGPVTLRQALAKSINIPTIKIQEEIGTGEVIKTARATGISTPIPEFRSIALGTAEVTLEDLTYAYAVFANNGIRVDPLFITRIDDKSGNILREFRPEQREVLPAPPVAVLNNMLETVMNQGTGASSRAYGFTLPAAGKTGTTDDYSDAWFVGYTPKIVTGVWVGYDQPRPIGSGMTGTRAALPIWTEIMKTATADDGSVPFEVPDQVVKRKVCAETGLPSTGACPETVTEIFLSQHVPTEMCYLHSTAFELRPDKRWQGRGKERDWSKEEEERHVGPEKP
jgi:penicillin-binding protein 1A